MLRHKQPSARSRFLADVRQRALGCHRGTARETVIELSDCRAIVAQVKVQVITAAAVKAVDLPTAAVYPHPNST